MGLYVGGVKVSVHMHQRSLCRGTSHALRNVFVRIIALPGTLLKDQAAVPGTAAQSSPLKGTLCARDNGILAHPQLGGVPTAEP